MSGNDWREIIKGMMDDGGMSYHGLSRALGKADSYMSGYLYSVKEPRASTLAAIAGACGYELHLTGHGKDIRIEP